MPWSGMLRLGSENILMGARADSKEDAIRQVAGILARCGFVEPGYAAALAGTLVTAAGLFLVKRPV